MLIKPSPKAVLIYNFSVIGLLLFMNIVSVISRLYFNNEITVFDFDVEGNLPTLYSFFNLLLSSALLHLIASHCKEVNRSLYPSWLSLSFIFLFLAFDELLSIHEKLGVVFKEVFDTSGFFHYAWVIPYGIAVFALLILYTKFLFKLPKNTLSLFLLAGGLFILGAIGFEMIGGNHMSQFGGHNLMTALYYTCEELFEMIGISVFIYALLIHITVNQGQSVSIGIVVRNQEHPQI